jgi:hypothetical protein
VGAISVQGWRRICRALRAVSQKYYLISHKDLNMKLGTIPKQLRFGFSALIGMLLTITIVPAQATVVAEGTVAWSFNVAPDSIRYLWPNQYVGAIRQPGSVPDSDLYLDSNWSAEVSTSNAQFSATWNPLTGDTAGAISSTASAAGAAGPSVFFNTLAGYSFYTDILSFSYDYDFFGSKDVESDWLSFFVQTEIKSGSDVFYSDYDSSVPEFRTNWAHSPTSNNLTVNAQGSVTYSYGVVGEYRNWFVRSDVLLAAKDSGGPRAAVPEPSSLLLLLIGFFVLFAVRRVRV